MVLAPGTRQVSWRRLREHIGQSRLSLASPEEVLQVTGYRIGTVSPFGLPHKLSLLVDRSILREEEISIGSGAAGIGIILSTHDLMRGLPEAEQVDLMAKP
jgi:prolyl-tRNA editing enzyme YbaK/EbsC (Cys-tRNA(Pro) deacylase)